MANSILVILLGFGCGTLLIRPQSGAFADKTPATFVSKFLHVSPRPLG